MHLNWLRRFLAVAAACLGLIASGGLAAAEPAASVLEGRWNGTLTLAADRLAVVVEIRRTADGRLAGTVAGLDQDNPFTIDAIEQEGATVRLMVGAASGGFQGTLSADGSRLSGNWSQLAIATPLELTRSSPGLASPPPR